MPSKKTLKRRLSGVNTTQKIIKAMNMVAASKLQKEKARLAANEPFFRESAAILSHLKHAQDITEHPFFKPRAVKNTAYLVITSDKGFCGSYNTNIAEAALTHMSDKRKEQIFVLGAKGYAFFSRHGKQILQKYDDSLDSVSYDTAARMSRQLTDLFFSNSVDEIYIAYTKFESVLIHTPQIEKLFPIDTAAKPKHSMKYEPDLSSFIDAAVPLYLSAFIYNALLESFACEQASRMLSMDTAADNAADIMDKLTHVYNRRRQAAITQEINELVSGTNG